MTIKSTCEGVKDLDLYILESACKFIKVGVVLLFKYEEFIFSYKSYLFVSSSFKL